MHNRPRETCWSCGFFFWWNWHWINLMCTLFNCLLLVFADYWRLGSTVFFLLKYVKICFCPVPQHNVVQRVLRPALFIHHCFFFFFKWEFALWKGQIEQMHSRSRVTALVVLQGNLQFAFYHLDAMLSKRGKLRWESRPPLLQFSSERSCNLQLATGGQE